MIKKLADTQAQNEEEGLTFYSDQEAMDEKGRDEEFLEEKRKKYVSPFDTINGEFDCLS
jgi:hypothetical protein